MSDRSQNATVTDSVSDPNGTAAEQLREIVANYGPKALDDPAFLARILPDLMSDQPRERRIVEAAATAGVADRLSTRISHGTPIPAAIVDVSRILSDQHALTLGAAEWAVSAYARALGHEPPPVAAPTVIDSPLPPQPAQPHPTQPQPAQPLPAQPQPAQPQPAAPHPGQPHPGQPQPQPAPSHLAQRVQPQQAQPQPVQPQPVQPQPVQPQPVPPQPMQPQQGPPGPAQPQPAQPQRVMPPVAQQPLVQQPMPQQPHWQTDQTAQPLPVPYSAQPAWSQPVEPTRPRIGKLLLMVGLPVFLVLAGICGVVVVVKFMTAGNDCVVGRWDMTSSTQSWAPSGTVRYTGSGTFTVVYNSDGTGAMINDRVEYDLGDGRRYTNTGTLTYRYTATGEDVNYSSVKGSMTTVLSEQGKPDQTTTSQDGPLTADKLSCYDDQLVLTGNGSSRNTDGTESTFTYRQEFARV